MLVPAWRSSLVGNAATEVHLPGVPVAPDLHVELLAQRVHAAHAHAVQPAGNLIGRRVELAAGVQLGQHHLHRRHLLAVGQIHHVHRNAAPVVDHGDRVVHVDHDVDLFGVPGQRLVHGVVHHLVDQVVQPHLAGRANVHGRPQANRLQAFQNLDVFAGIAAVISIVVRRGTRLVTIFAIVFHQLGIDFRFAGTEFHSPYIRFQARFGHVSNCANPCCHSATNRLKDRGFTRICMNLFYHGERCENGS